MRSKLKSYLAILGLTVLGLLALSGNAAAQWEAMACGGVCLLIALLPIIITILIAVWVYKDAKSRGMNGVLWAILAIIIPYFIGIIIYLIVRRSHPVLPEGGYPPPPPGAYPPPPGSYPPPPPPR